MLEVDDLDLVDAEVDELVDVVEVELVAGAVELLLLAVDLGLDGLGEDAVDRLVLLGALGADGDLLGFIEGLDDVLAAVEAEGAEEHGAEDALLAVDLGVDELLLLVDLELEPASAVRNDARGVDRPSRGRR